jgi:hypothetical protein
MLWFGLTDKDFKDTLEEWNDASIQIGLDALDENMKPIHKQTHRTLKRLRRLDDLFDPRWLPHYEYEKSDLDWFLSESNIDQDRLDDFEKFCFLVLPDIRIVNLNPREFLYFQRSTLDENKHPQWNPKKVSFRDKLGKVRRAQIYARPSNYREAVCVNHNTLSTLKYIDSHVLQILQHCEGDCVHIKDRNTLQRKISSFHDNKSTFLMRDFKKFGLTVDCRIYSAILRALHKRYPNVKAFGYTNVFTQGELVNNDGEHLGKIRGPGLGLHYSLGSLLQILLDRYLMKVGYDTDSDFDMESLVFNDDYVAKFKTESDRLGYESVKYVLDELGIITKKKSTFYSKGKFQFLNWQYGRRNDQFNWDVVNSVRREMAVFNQINISEAKRYASSLNEKAFYRGLKSWIRFWGYEFFPEEACYSYSFGGWKKDDKLLDLSTCRHPNVKKAYLAVKAKITYKNKWFKKIRKRYKAGSYKPVCVRDGYFINEEFPNLFKDYSKNEMIRKSVRVKFSAKLRNTFARVLMQTRNEIYRRPPINCVWDDFDDSKHVCHESFLEPGEHIMDDVQTFSICRVGLNQIRSALLFYETGLGDDYSPKFLPNDRQRTLHSWNRDPFTGFTADEGSFSILAFNSITSCESFSRPIEGGNRYPGLKLKDRWMNKERVEKRLKTFGTLEERGFQSSEEFWIDRIAKENYEKIVGRAIPDKINKVEEIVEKQFLESKEEEEEKDWVALLPEELKRMSQINT